MEESGKLPTTPSLLPIVVTQDAETSASLKRVRYAFRTFGALLSLAWCVGYIIVGITTEGQECDFQGADISLVFLVISVPFFFACVCCSCGNADFGYCRRVPGTLLQPFKMSCVGTVWGFEIMFLVTSSIFLERFSSQERFVVPIISIAFALGIHILKWKIRDIQSNKRMKLFWGLSACLVVEFDAVFFILNSCNDAVIFPAGAALVRIIAVIYALCWTPPIVNSEKQSDTVVVEPSTTSQKQKSGFHAGSVHIRRLDLLEKFSPNLVAGPRVRLKQHGKWARRTSCCCSFMSVVLSVPSFVYGIVGTRGNFQPNDPFYSV